MAEPWPQSGAAIADGVNGTRGGVPRGGRGVRNYTDEPITRFTGDSFYQSAYTAVRFSSVLRACSGVLEIFFAHRPSVADDRRRFRKFPVDRAPLSAGAGLFVRHLRARGPTSRVPRSSSALSAS